MTTAETNINWKRWIVRAALIFICVGCLVGGCNSINRKLGLDDDHFVEEMAERFIESETGLDIDLTPESSEL